MTWLMRRTKAERALKQTAKTAKCASKSGTPKACSNKPHTALERSPALRMRIAGTSD